MGDEIRRGGRPADPGRFVAPVGVHVGWEFGFHEQSAVGKVLGDAGVEGPAHEDVAVGEDFHAAAGGRVGVVRALEGGEDLGEAVVEREHEAAGVVVGRLSHAAVASRVVEERDEGVGVVGLPDARVMLARELSVADELKV